MSFCFCGQVFDVVVFLFVLVVVVLVTIVVAAIVVDAIGIDAIGINAIVTRAFFVAYVLQAARNLFGGSVAFCAVLMDVCAGSGPLVVSAPFLSKFVQDRNQMRESILDL